MLEDLADGSSVQEKPAPLLAFGARVVLVGVALSLLQQLMGLNAISYYGPQILQRMGYPHGRGFLGVLVARSLNLLATMVVVLIVDRVGRKPLLIFGALIMGLSMMALGALFENENTGAYGLMAMCCYMVGLGMSFGPIVWIMMSEIFPAPIRGQAMSMAIAAQWGANFLVSFTFPVMFGDSGLNALAHGGFAFWIYGGFGIAGGVRGAALRAGDERRGRATRSAGRRLAGAGDRILQAQASSRFQLDASDPADRAAEFELRGVACGLFFGRWVAAARAPAPGSWPAAAVPPACAWSSRAPSFSSGWGSRPFGPDAQLRAVTLRTPFVDADAVVDDGELPARRVAGFGGAVDEIAALAHERRLADGMQRDAPGGLRALVADQRDAGPAEHRDDLPQPAGVGAMHLFEARVIFVVEMPGGGQFVAHAWSCASMSRSAFSSDSSMPCLTPLCQTAPLI